MNRLRSLRPSALLLAVLAGCFLGLWFISTARAQGIETLPVLLADPMAWLRGLAVNPVLVGLAVFGFVSTIKRDAERRRPPLTWNPWIWRGASAATALVLSGVLHLTTGLAVLVTAGWGGVTWFALVAAVIAVIGRDGLKTVLGWVTVALGSLEAGPAAQTGDDPPDLPRPGADGSPQTNGNEAVDQELVGAAPLFGLPPAITAIAGSLLGSAPLETVVKALLHAAGLPAGVADILAVGARLAQIAPDLFDGNPQLDTTNLSKINRVILDLKAEHLRGSQ